MCMDGTVGFWIFAFEKVGINRRADRKESGIFLFFHAARHFPYAFGPKYALDKVAMGSSWCGNRL